MTPERRIGHASFYKVHPAEHVNSERDVSNTYAPLHRSNTHWLTYCTSRNGVPIGDTRYRSSSTRHPRGILYLANIRRAPTQQDAVSMYWCIHVSICQNRSFLLHPGHTFPQSFAVRFPVQGRAEQSTVAIRNMTSLAFIFSRNVFLPSGVVLASAASHSASRAKRAEFERKGFHLLSMAFLNGQITRFFFPSQTKAPLT